MDNSLPTIHYDKARAQPTFCLRASTRPQPISWPYHTAASSVLVKYPIMNDFIIIKEASDFKMEMGVCYITGPRNYSCYRSFDVGNVWMLSLLESSKQVRTWQDMSIHRIYKPTRSLMF